MLRAQSDPPTPHGRHVPALAALLIACALCGRAVYFWQAPNSDTAMFVYMGKLITTGGRLGVDLVDNKLPSVGLLMSVPYRLIGAHWWGYTLLGLLMTITASMVLARSAGRCFGRQAVVPVLVASAVWLNIPPMVYGLLQLETIQVFLIALAAAAGIECIVGGKARHAMVAGLFIGLAMWAKPTAGAIAPALALGLFIRTDWPVAKRLRSIATLALGALIPLIVCALLVVHLGMADALPATMKQLRDYSANSTAAWVDAIKPLFVAMVLLFPLLVLGWVFRRDRIDVEKREQSCDAVAARRALVAFVIAWFAMETIAVVAQRRMYAYHFLVMGPPAAMLLALVARRLRVVSLGFALGPAALMCVLWAGQIFSLPNDQKRLESVIAYLRTHSNDSDCVWLDDYPRLMVETDLKPGSRVPLVFLFGNSDAAPLYFGDMILTDLQSRRPERIVLYQDPSRYVDFYRHHMVEIAEFPQRGQNFDTAWHAIDRYTRAHYEVETTIDRMNVYRRKSEAREEVEHTATLIAGE